MVASQQSVVDEASPVDVYRTLSQDDSAALVDVRTRAEWTFIGLPDIATTEKPLWPIEWVSFPAMGRNERFMDQLLEMADGALPPRLFFICRSGARSLAAARAVAEEAERRGTPVHCTNVSEGFEGDLDAEGHRGTINGWKVHGLPWRQS